MKIKFLALLVMLLTALICNAAEFWISSSKSKYALNEEMLIAFLEGDGFLGEPWDLKKHKIEKLALYRRSGVVDLRKQVQPEARIKLKVKMSEPGTQVLALQSDFTSAAMAATAFNDYLRENGLEEVLKQRAATNSLSKPSRELVGRFVKLIVQVGDKPDEMYKTRTGMRIEIIPLQNPLTLHTGDHLDCLILFNGKPSPHQLVKVWNKIAHSSFLQDIYTENDGTIRFPINARGRWMVSTVSMIPSEVAGADWQSLWASLVFII